MDTDIIPAVKTGLELLAEIEEKLFEKRTTMEVLWLEIGGLCSEVVTHKLYRLRRDEQGNYFRTAKAYFQDLERQFKEKGLPMSYTSLNRFISDHRLYKEELGYEDTDLLTMGKCALDQMAPAVRKKLKEEGQEAAKAFVDEVLEAARANDGIPLDEVRKAVDDATGRVTKGLEVSFKDGIFGRVLDRMVLWWNDQPYDVVKQEISEEQAQWVERRLGIKAKDNSPLL